MSLKRLRFDQKLEVCHTCMFIDEYAFNVNEEGETPCGYDGTAICCIHNNKEEESNDNRLFISPCWDACKKYKRCTERQADYLDVYSEEKQTIIKNPNYVNRRKSKCI
jgi:hypothetical protein